MKPGDIVLHTNQFSNKSENVMYLSQLDTQPDFNRYAMANILLLGCNEIIQVYKYELYDII